MVAGLLMPANPLPLFGVSQSLLGRSWLLVHGNDALADQLMRTQKISALAARVLANRLPDEAAALAFLNPSLRDHLPDPSNLQDMDKAVDRTIAALEAQQPVAILGDYDVDGQTSISVLAGYLRAIGVAVQFVSPDRLSEGYGPNAARLENFARDGAKLAFTVDCGTTAFAAFEAANKAGLDVIVLDHHAQEDTLPSVHALVNPNRRDDVSGCGYLAAVGVTFLFVVALNRALRQRGYFTATRPEPDLKYWLDIVALGTVADVVPLVGANRALVVRGLEIMAQSRHIGLVELMKVAGLTVNDPANLPDAFDLGFRLGPRINAGGRIGKCDLGANLLLAQTVDEAQGLAAELDQLNQERRAIGERIERESAEAAEAQVERGGACIVVADESWHPGVIGIGAGRLKERFGLPAFVVGAHGGRFTGSGRSIKGVDLGAVVHQALHEGILVKGGGHKMAAGITITPEMIPVFQTFASQACAAQIHAMGGKPPVEVDLVAAPETLSVQAIEQLNRLAPFGAENPMPKVALQAMEVSFSKAVGGDGNTVTCTLRSPNGATIKGISFRAASEPHGQALLNGRGQRFHVLGEASINVYQGQQSPQLQILDVAPA